MKKIIIFGINSDIGSNVARFFLKKKQKVKMVGTFRKKEPSIILENKNYLEYIQCDFIKSKDLNKLRKFLKRKKFNWDIIFSSIGTTEPIGRFFDLKFKDWKRSININMISQLEAIHKIYPMRNKKKNCNIIFLAGGGTNNPFRYYSSYTVSKIGLIKMCELLDDEYKNLNVFILGPGLTRTKGHLETIKAGKAAKSNFFKIKKFLASKRQGTEFKTIYECINWGINSGKKVVGGRNFSIVHDNWKSKKIIQKLKRDKNMFKLRRCGNK